MKINPNDNLSSFSLIDNADLDQQVKIRARAALSSMVYFNENARNQWASEVDFDFLAKLVIRLASSGSSIRALSGDIDADNWFEDNHLPEPKDSALVLDESFGVRRIEAAAKLRTIQNGSIRAMVYETLGTALLLQMFEHVMPRIPQDFVFLAEAAEHAFSSSEVVSLWKK